MKSAKNPLASGTEKRETQMAGFAGNAHKGVAIADAETQVFGNSRRNHESRQPLVCDALRSSSIGFPSPMSWNQDELGRETIRSRRGSVGFQSDCLQVTRLAGLRGLWRCRSFKLFVPCPWRRNARRRDPCRQSGSAKSLRHRVVLRRGTRSVVWISKALPGAGIL
jgi:hypothetical protein